MMSGQAATVAFFFLNSLFIIPYFLAATRGLLSGS